MLYGIVFKFDDEFFLSLYDDKTKEFVENTIGLKNADLQINDDQMFLCEVIVKDGTAPIEIENVSDFATKKHEPVCYFYDIDVYMACTFEDTTIKEIIEEGDFLDECLSFYNEAMDENMV